VNVAVNGGATVVASAQVLVLVAVSPLVVGLMRTVRARLEGRVGAGIAQPWRDLRKLLAKESLRADGTSWVSVAGPVLLMASSLVVCALTPVLGTVTFDRAPDDLFVVVSVLLLGTVAVALVGLDAGSAFGGSRRCCSRSTRSRSRSGPRCCRRSWPPGSTTPPRSPRRSACSRCWR
jgi:formate hydrogenlyase subunit 4